MTVTQPLGVDVSGDITFQDACRRAAAAFERDDFQQTGNLCRKILLVRPHYSPALVMLGRMEAAQGRLAMAEATLHRAVTLAPADTEARRQLEKLRSDIEMVRSSNYMQTFLHQRQVYMDYPRNVAIEFGGLCNGKCSFCPHHQLERKGTALSDELFEKILADLQEIPPYLPTNIFTNVINEPFLDKKIFQRLRRINEGLPNRTIYVYTNLNVVGDDFFEKINSVRNVVCLSVSLNAANQADYEATTGMDFNRTIGNLRRFLTLHRERPFLSMPVVLSRVRDDTQRDQQFLDQCRALLADFQCGSDYSPALFRRANFLGQVAGSQSPIPHAFPCHRWMELCIFCNGIVPHCCMDANGEHAIGDVRERSLLEIYSSRRFRRLREGRISRECTHPCNVCALM